MRSLFALLLILCAVVIAQEPQTKPASPSHGVKHQEPSNDDKDDSGNHVPPSAGITHTTTFVLQESPQQNDERRKQPSYWGKVISPEILPIWIASLIAIIGTFVAVCTLFAIKREAIEIQDVAKAAAKNADATHKTVEALMMGQRAWVIVTIGDIPPFTPEPNTLEILWVKPTFINCGKTPARITRIRAREHQVSKVDELPEEPIYEGTGIIVAKFDGNAFLPPNANVQPVNVGISGSDFVPIRQGKSVLYLYGFVDYLDVYDRQRTTRFCFIYHVPGGFNPSPEAFYLGGPARYNEAPEQKKKDG